MLEADTGLDVDHTQADRPLQEVSSKGFLVPFYGEIGQINTEINADVLLVIESLIAIVGSLKVTGQILAQRPAFAAVLWPPAQTNS
ncbi:hypothetical protein [Halioglobus sp. HI00S01]|uniref:hypothetical protein n=1 Tax=Halioglobus sp. HI00S01 TaxID=1822214 RepID=UPI0012E75967|nr:hypothetical protein [Halioglobus sp. HI00S01]